MEDTKQENNEEIDTPTKTEQNEKLSLKAKLKVFFIEWCQSLTAHAIPRIAGGNSLFVKILWTLLFLGFFSYCLSTIISSAEAYLRYETTISITQRQEMPATFPAVTVCNINAFHEDNYNELMTMLNQISLNDAVASCLYLYNDTTLFHQCQNLLFSNPNSSFNQMIYKIYNYPKVVVANEKRLNQSMREYFGFQLKRDMLFRCSFNDKTCNEVNFQYFWDNNYGNCYTFNSNSSDMLKTSQTGKKSGLIMELIVKSAHNPNMVSDTTGLYVVVHNQSDLPMTLDTGVSIATGYETYIGINRVFTSKLDGHFSNCIKDMSKSDNAYANQLFQYFRDLGVVKYDQTFCLSLCYQDKLIDRCMCADLITPTMRNASYCVNTDELECMAKFKEEMSKQDLSEVCEFACMEQCKRIDYNFRISMATYPGFYYMYQNLFSKRPNAFPNVTFTPAEMSDFSRDSLLKVIVNYEDLYYTLIEESEKLTVEDLLGNIGGQLGLFIGISILSIFELVELIVQCIIICMEHRKNKIADSENLQN